MNELETMPSEGSEIPHPVIQWENVTPGPLTTQKTPEFWEALKSEIQSAITMSEDPIHARLFPKDRRVNVGEDEPVTAKIINEGEFYTVIMLQTEFKGEQTRLILTAPMNLAEGNEQIRSDGTLLPRLREFLTTNNLPLTVPEIYQSYDVSILLHGKNETVWVNLEKYLADFTEISFRASSITSLEGTYDLNIPVEQAKHGMTHEEINTQEITKYLARSLYFVFRAFDGKLPKKLAINRGDFVCAKQNDELRLGLITIQGGLSEKLDLKRLLAYALTHTEKGFSPIAGVQEQDVYPFSQYADQTIEGMWEAVGYLQDTFPVSEDEFRRTLQELREDPDIQKVPFFEDSIVPAINNFLKQ